VGPLRVKLKLLLAFLSWLCDGDEIRTGATAVNLFICDSLVIESEVAGRLLERRVDDRVFDDDLGHMGTFTSM